MLNPITFALVLPRLLFSNFLKLKIDLFVHQMQVIFTQKTNYKANYMYMVKDNKENRQFFQRKLCKNAPSLTDVCTSVISSKILLPDVLWYLTLCLCAGQMPRRRAAGRGRPRRRTGGGGGPGGALGQEGPWRSAGGGGGGRGGDGAVTGGEESGELTGKVGNGRRGVGKSYYETGFASSLIF